MLVQASGLVKQYPRIRALDQVSLEIKEGEVFGLFGPNGAGKTTCLRVLSGLTQPDQGGARADGAGAGHAEHGPDALPRRTFLERGREHAHRAAVDPPRVGLPRWLDPLHEPQSP